MISTQQLAQYDERGFLVLEGFADEAECDQLRARAEELVREFDPADVVSIFSTHEQNRLTDDYFLTSGDKIRFFFEENAFNPDGALKYENAFNPDGALKYEKEKCIQDRTRAARSRSGLQSFLTQS